MSRGICGSWEVVSYISPESTAAEKPCTAEGARACPRYITRTESEAPQTVREQRPSFDSSGAFAEHLLLFQVLYSVRSEDQMMEQLDNNLYTGGSWSFA